ncbi:hypothetical protein SH580_19685 [Coraliomargarita algicola]|uniref:Uncharacterized protein n=1 Tax=Coraliomargarita algicola TaxID=3092156 RepID=A0ABZ0RJJ1_9BACT|nr:hypothetical protein [Coraliomargarita sp. J2-16]WPJ95643.1 hypothetical protein SH580_19685 [Coraliomargarita sp. J2-16]
MPTSADIMARMAMDSNPFLGELHSNVKETKKASTSMSKEFKAVAGAAGLSVAGVGALATAAMETANEIETLAGIAGTGVEDFQRLAFAAKGVRIEQEKLADIYKDTQEKIGEFLRSGGGPMKAFFEEIAPLVGVTAEEFRHLSGPDALQLYYDSIEKANVSNSEMVSYMEEIASDATALIPLLANSGAEFERLGKKAKVMGEDTVQALSEARKSIEEFKKDMVVFAGEGLGALYEYYGGLSKLFASVVTGRNLFREFAEAEAALAEAEEALAAKRAKRTEETAKAAEVEAVLAEETREYVAVQASAIEMAEQRAAAEKKLREEFESSVAEYIKAAELEAMQTRAAGDAAAADAMDARIHKMKEAARVAKRYGISLEEAANLVQKLAEQEAAAAKGTGTGSPGAISGSAAADVAAQEAEDDRVRGKIRPGQIQNRRPSTMRARELAAGLYNTTLGRNGAALDGMSSASSSSTPSATDRAESNIRADNPSQGVLVSMERSLKVIESEMTKPAPRI